MNLELTIQHMFDEYPSLFVTRKDCLNHLFCVIGNGYSWNEKGELESNHLLEDNIDIETLKSHLVNGKAYQHNPILNEKQLSLYYASTAKTKKDSDFWLRNAEKESTENELVRGNISGRKMWYFCHPISGETVLYKEFAYIWNLPENIAPDWLDAVNECKKLLAIDFAGESFVDELFKEEN